MDYATSELNTISRQLAGLGRTKKAKMLVVDDEPDNLDLLYRTFRRDFQVLKAESGVHALEMLESEGEVAVIISDQRMPEMKGTEFLSRTVPQFPDTMRIILTGFTDVEDLVEAINSGQVYKYITKPWDPGELKAVVQRAAETYDLLKQRTEELRQSQAQTALLSAIVRTAQESASLEESLTSITSAFGKNFQTDGCILQLVEGKQLHRDAKVIQHQRYAQKLAGARSAGQRGNRHPENSGGGQYSIGYCPRCDRALRLIGCPGTSAAASGLSARSPRRAVVAMASTSDVARR